MNKKNENLVSAEELDALIGSWGSNPQKGLDLWSPWRFWYLATVVGYYIYMLLFNTHAVAEGLSTDPAEVTRLTRFLYFRGWFLFFAISVGFYAYLKAWYTAIVFCALALMGGVNLLLDLFSVYAEVLSNPSPRLTALMMVRLLALLLLIISVKNVSRLPPLGDRLNLLLPFKKPSNY